MSQRHAQSRDMRTAAAGIPSGVVIRTLPSFKDGLKLPAKEPFQVWIAADALGVFTTKNSVVISSWTGSRK
jgi:hypothetical protein